jgi:hypothetical protein
MALADVGSDIPGAGRKGRAWKFPDQLSAEKPKT